MNLAFGMAEKLRVDAIDEILAGISVLLDFEVLPAKTRVFLWMCRIWRSSESQ